MPMDIKRYPANWLEISKRIRFERAKHCCEWCHAPNGAWIVRYKNDEASFEICTESEAADFKGDHVFHKPVRVVLTVAHLGTPHTDGTPGDKHDKMDVRDENLAALCQRCHLAYDLQDHIQHRRENREAKRRETEPVFPALEAVA